MGSEGSLEAGRGEKLGRRGKSTSEEGTGPWVCEADGDRCVQMEKMVVCI